MRAELLCLIAAFVLTVPWGGWLIRELLRRGIGKNIRDDEPESHRIKGGTATMGGIHFLVGATVVVAIVAALGQPIALLPLLAIWVFGLLGVIDDLRGLRAGGGEGWLARNKFAWQWGLAGLVSLATYLLTNSHPLIIPISGAQIEIGAWQIPLLAYLLVAFSNAVNLADGLDGLAGGMSAISYGALGLLAAWTGQHGLGQAAMAMVGALLAFLWYNAHPARVFMGDIGAQALGAGLASVAVLSGHWLLLPIIGIVFVAESLSVMVQVSYFKYTRRRYGEGRRILRMAPLHYHYEKGGWSETWIVARFWLISALAAACGLVLGLV